MHKEKRREKQTVNIPRQYFDIREDGQLSIKITKYPCLFNISNAGYKEKDRIEKALKILMINWESKKVLPYAMKRYFLILCYLFRT